MCSIRRDAGGSFGCVDAATSPGDAHLYQMQAFRKTVALRPSSVDDNPILRVDMADIFETVSSRMLAAGDGDEAIAVLEQHHLNVALSFSDVEMPGTRDGSALAHEVAVKWPARRDRDRFGTGATRVPANYPRVPVSSASRSAPRRSTVTCGKSFRITGCLRRYGAKAPSGARRKDASVRAWCGCDPRCFDFALSLRS